MSLDFVLFAISVLLWERLSQVEGHGRLIEPASRNSMWRYKYKNPRNYNDMGLNCGGFTNQFERHMGRCGVCGDPWEGSRDHEAGGKYARGLVARQYRVGAFINITVELTSNHMGYFEFRLCPVNDPKVKATQACLDQHVLNVVGHGTRYFITMREQSRFEEMIIMLPPKLQCSQCVLQWKWVAGQSMGPDGYGGECLGCGNQEHFINCADIAIGPKAVKPLAGPLPPQPAAPPANSGPAYNVNGNGYGTTVGTGYSVKMVTNNHKNMNYKQKSKTAYDAAPSNVQTWTQQPGTNAPANTWNQPAQTWDQPSTTGWPDMGLGNWNGGNPLLSWTNEPPNNDYFPSEHAPQGAPNDYAGLEPGEYPEIGEGQPAEQSGGQYNAGSGQESGYMRGFNDAIRKLTQQFGVSGTGGFPNKGSNVLAEVTRTFQESQKFSGGFNPIACPDGTEPSCKASGQSAGSAEFDNWCTNTCSNGECPRNLCTCTCEGSGSTGWSSAGSGGGYCRSVDRNKASSMDKWCQLNCKQNNCPSNLCTCG